MTGDFDNISALIDYLMENPSDSIAWMILRNILEGIHDLAHDLGSGRIHISRPELQTDKFLSAYRSTKPWMSVLRDFLQKRARN